MKIATRAVPELIYSCFHAVMVAWETCQEFEREQYDQTHKNAAKIVLQYECWFHMAVIFYQRQNNFLWEMFVLQYNIYSLATFIAQLRKLKCPTFFQNFEKKKNKQMKHLKLDLEMFRSNFAGVCNENFFFFFFFTVAML